MERHRKVLIKFWSLFLSSFLSLSFFFSFLSFRVSKKWRRKRKTRKRREEEKKRGMKTTTTTTKLLFIKRHVSARRVDEKKTMRKTRGGGGGTTVAVRMVAPKKKSVSFVKSRDEFSTKRRGGKRSPLAEMSMNEKDDEDDDEERDSPMTARRKWNKEQRGANEKTMGTRWKATAMDKVLILTRRVESLEVREFWSFFSLSLFLGRITVNKRSSSSV